MWHRMVCDLIAAYDPTDVVGMQNDPMMRTMAKIEKEELGERKDQDRPE